MSFMDIIHVGVGFAIGMLTGMVVGVIIGKTDRYWL